MELLKCTIAGLPPSVNHIYRTAGRRRYKTAEGRQWQEYVSLILKRMYNGDTFTGFCRVSLVFTSKDKRRWDVDNRIKSVQDCLTMAGIIKDDSQVIELSARREFGDVDQTQIAVSKIEK